MSATAAHAASTAMVRLSAIDEDAPSEVRPTKVLIATLLSEHGPTGVQTHVECVARMLRVRGLTVEVVTPFAQPKHLVYPVFALRRLIDPIHGAASVWWYRYWHEQFLRAALKRRLQSRNDVVVYAQCPLSARAALRAREAPSQRVVLVVHFNESQADEWAEKGRICAGGTYFEAIRQLEAEILSQLDGLVFVSEFMRARLLRRIPRLKKMPHAVIPNFCNGSHVPQGAAPTQGDLITIGTLEPRKNQAFLLEVLAHAAQLGHRYSLDVVGDGPDRGSLARLAAQLGVHEQVRFHGYQPQAASHLPGHRAYVHAATMENCPITLIEAMSCGLPIFAPAVGGIPELVDDEQEGFHWSLADARAAAERLIGCLEDKVRHASVAAAALRKYETKLTAERVAGRLADFLVSVMNSGVATTASEVVASELELE